MKKIVKDLGELPISVLQLFANRCGVDGADLNSLLELQAIIIEEVIDKDVEASNVFLAFREVKDSVEKRWKDWLNDFALNTYDV